MIGGKMLGTDLAFMIADIKRVSQVFRGFKSTDMLEIPQDSFKILSPQQMVCLIKKKNRKNTF